MSLQPRSPHEIVRDLHALGVAAGDALMVHAWLRRIGPVPWMAAHLAAFAGRS
jgi:aminoglycoside N3'-acetyltransferase